MKQLNGNGRMNAYSLNDDDIKALAHYMSRQPGK
jgi:cytochrome c553